MENLNEERERELFGPEVNQTRGNPPPRNPNQDIEGLMRDFLNTEKANELFCQYAAERGVQVRRGGEEAKASHHGPPRPYEAHRDREQSLAVVGVRRGNLPPVGVGNNYRDPDNHNQGH